MSATIKQLRPYNMGQVYKIRPRAGLGQTVHISPASEIELSPSAPIYSGRMPIDYSGIPYADIPASVPSGADLSQYLQMVGPTNPSSSAIPGWVLGVGAIALLLLLTKK